MRALGALAIAALAGLALVQPLGARAAGGSWGALVLDASPHLWYRMARVLVERLYDPELGLFRETWGTPEGRCWYWNTEQGEAVQALAYLGDSGLLAAMLDGYRRYLTYSNGSIVYPFSRYTPCRLVRILSADPTGFSVGNLIVNLGGDLAGARRDGYSRLIALGLDAYKAPGGPAWPTIWFTAASRGDEVWYRAPGNRGYYRGIWDTSDGSLGAGRIVGYSITYNSTYANATRVMSDGRLVYEQQFIVGAGKPYVKVLLVVRNNSTETLSGVRVTLAFDELDRLLYQAAYAPGLGVFNASEGGTTICGGEREYTIADSRQGKWRPLGGWWVTILYTNRPLGMNRALAVMINSSYPLRVWGYGNLQAPQAGLRGNPEYTSWYLRWVKFEVDLGSLAPGEARVVEARLVPMASYAPGLEGLYTQMLAHLDRLDGRDLSFALNTGTGAFEGLALAGILLDTQGKPGLALAEEVIESVGSVMRGWHWRVSTRVLANYILALLNLYNYTHRRAYLGEAEEAAETLLASQVRSPGDPRDGGFLDAPPPYGAAAYLDVSAEAARALLALYNATHNQAYREAVDYWLAHWFHHDNRTGQWYYYRYKTPQEAPGKQWYRGTLYGEQPYAQGYLLQALAPYKPGHGILQASASKVWALLTSGYWERTHEGASETNVETQAATTAGLRAYLLAQVLAAGAGVEYVRGARLEALTHEQLATQTARSTGCAMATLAGILERRAGVPAIVAIYIHAGPPQSITIGGAPLERLSSLRELAATQVDSYYWDPASGILYLKLATSNTFQITYLRTSTGDPLRHTAIPPACTATHPQQKTQETPQEAPTTLSRTTQPHSHTGTKTPNSTLTALVVLALAAATLVMLTLAGKRGQRATQ